MLLQSRKLLLEHADFDVVSCHESEVLDELRRDPAQYDAALLGQSIRLERRLDVARQMRKIAPDLAIVLMHFPEDRFDASMCDAVVETLSDPESLPKAIRRAMKKRGKAA
jgi:two-component SAPR family response regulator